MVYAISSTSRVTKCVAMTSWFT